MSTKLTKEFLEQEFTTKSIRQVADEQGTYPNKIRRTAIKLGVVLPDKAASYQNSLKAGRIVPPMLGKEHSAESKTKISQKRHDRWEETKQDPAEMERLRKVYRKGMMDKSKAEVKDMRDKAAKAIRATRSKGSKLERFIMEQLFAAGYEPQFHARNVVIQQDLEVDICLPKNRIASEVDGVTHSEDIYGAEQLAKRRFADSKKNGLLLAAGCTIIRLDNTVKHVTKWFLENSWKKLLTKLQELEENPVGAQIVYLD